MPRCSVIWGQSGYAGAEALWLDADEFEPCLRRPMARGREYPVLAAFAGHKGS